MKTIISIACSFLLLSTASASPLPQPVKNTTSVAAFNNSFIRFNVHRQQHGAALDWSFTDPNNIVCFVVERSYDGEYFELLAEVSANNRNQYKDHAVYPGYIHYRIGALMYDGSVVYSTIEVLRIVSRK